MLKPEIIVTIDAITCLGETLKSMNESTFQNGCATESVVSLIGHLAQKASLDIFETKSAE